MEKLFETKEGVVLYFDDNTYQTDDINAVKNALNQDVQNFDIDINAVIMVHNILVIIDDVDNMASFLS